MNATHAQHLINNHNLFVPVFTCSPFAEFIRHTSGSFLSADNKLVDSTKLVVCRWEIDCNSCCIFPFSEPNQISYL